MISYIWDNLNIKYDDNSNNILKWNNLWICSDIKRGGDRVRNKKFFWREERRMIVINVDRIIEIEK